MTKHLLILFTLFLMAGCSDSSPARDFPTATTKQVEHITGFLEDGFTIRNVYSAKTEASRETATGYFVAAEIVGSGGYVGVWWHGGTPEKPGMVMAVDHMADEVCACPWVRNTRSSVSMDDPPAKELKRYVENRL